MCCTRMHTDFETTCNQQRHEGHIVDETSEYQRCNYVTTVMPSFHDTFASLVKRYLNNYFLVFNSAIISHSTVVLCT